MENLSNLILHRDAFSSGQISSKLWLCEELERTRWTSNETAIYGGWYAVTAFLLLSRTKFKVHKIRSYDIDASCEPMADLLNENWVWQDWKFKAVTADCNEIKIDADLIINTSTEHFNTKSWFDNIDYGTRVVLQGNNMTHDDHVVYSENLQQFINHYPLTKIRYSGQMDFEYPSWSFTRFMVIGIK